jgi:putative ABC transport system permease protein
MIGDLFRIPFQEIMHRKLRSWLTLLGIIIGIAAVTSLITIGQGLENSITKQFELLGNDKLFINAKGNTLTPGLSVDAVKITEDDLEVIENTVGVKNSAGMIFSTGKIEFNDNVRYFIISGVPSEFKKRELIGESQNFKLLKGRTLRKGDKHKVILGFEYLNKDLFGKSVDIGDKIIIHDQEFKVIGFWQKIGSPPDDKSLMIPIETYYELFGNKGDLGLLIAQVQPGQNLEQVSEKISKNLRKHRNLDEDNEDFVVETPGQLLESFAIILDIVQFVLIGIAAISLLVGGVGITNTIYTSVLQRTREIGVIKAVGAKNSHILILFTIESGFYGLGGGILGIIIGLSFAKLVGSLFVLFVGPAFLLIKIDWLMVLGTLIFSFIVGTIAGITPAYKASKLKPVDALRYE